MWLRRPIKDRWERMSRVCRPSCFYLLYRRCPDSTGHHVSSLMSLPVLSHQPQWADALPLKHINTHTRVAPDGVIMEEHHWTRRTFHIRSTHRPSLTCLLWEFIQWRDYVIRFRLFKIIWICLKSIINTQYTNYKNSKAKSFLCTDLSFRSLPLILRRYLAFTGVYFMDTRWGSVTCLDVRCKQSNTRKGSFKNR